MKPVYENIIYVNINKRARKDFMDQYFRNCVSNGSLAICKAGNSQLHLVIYGANSLTNLTDLSIHKSRRDARLLPLRVSNYFRRLCSAVSHG